MGAVTRGIGDVFSGLLPGILGGGRDRQPALPAPPAAPDIPASQRRVPGVDDAAVGETAERQRRRQAAASGRTGTILTSPLGLTEPAATARRQLLGR